MSSVAPAKVARRNVLLAGLPSAGKTSFLACFWYAVRRTSADADLALSRLPPNAEALHRITEAWLSCEVPDHTSIGALMNTTLALRRGSEAPFELVIPDYSGEFLRNAWVLRRWPPELANHLANSSAVLLLVHPSEVVPHETVESVSRRADLLQAGAPEENLQPTPFDLGAVPTQTMLVEFLQFVARRSRTKLLPVAVVVSAWDLVAAEGKTPPQWLASDLPLLHQFLVANSGTLPSTVFGLSAQGVQWPEKRDASREVLPAERAFVVDASGKTTQDVTSIVSWAVSGP